MKHQISIIMLLIAIAVSSCSKPKNQMPGNQLPNEVGTAFVHYQITDATIGSLSIESFVAKEITGNIYFTADPSLVTVTQNATGLVTAEFPVFSSSNGAQYQLAFTANRINSQQVLGYFVTPWIHNIQPNGSKSY